MAKTERVNRIIRRVEKKYPVLLDETVKILEVKKIAPIRLPLR